jgi:hypothetical protein
MKKLCVGLSILLFAAGVQAGNSKLVLGTEAGLPGECEVSGYDVETGLVKLRAGSNFGTRPIESFPTNVQAKIIGWAADEAFDSSSGLKIKVTEKETKTKKSVKKPTSQPRFDGNISTVIYTISLENCSPFELKGITVDAQVFFERQEHPQQVRTQLSVDLFPGETKEFQTKPVQIRNGDLVNTYIVTERSFSGYGGFGYSESERISKTDCKDRLSGVYVVAAKPDREGVPVRREVKKGQIPKEKEERNKISEAPSGDARIP